METHYYSFSMRSNVTMNVFIPTPGSDGSITQMNSTEKYDYVKGIPVVYLLHGAYGDAFSWIRYSNIDRYAQDRGIAVVMASAEGKGSIFSFVSVAILQGTITLLATLIKPVMTTQALSNLSLVGSILIFCVGLNLIFGQKIRVANFLPALVFAVVFAFIPGF